MFPASQKVPLDIALGIAKAVQKAGKLTDLRPSFTSLLLEIFVFWTDALPSLFPTDSDLVNQGCHCEVGENEPLFQESHCLLSEEWLLSKRPGEGPGHWWMRAALTVFSCNSQYRGCCLECLKKKKKKLQTIYWVPSTCWPVATQIVSWVPSMSPWCGLTQEAREAQRFNDSWKMGGPRFSLALPLPSLMRDADVWTGVRVFNSPMVTGHLQLPLHSYHKQSHMTCPFQPTQAHPGAWERCLPWICPWRPSYWKTP